MPLATASQAPPSRKSVAEAVSQANLARTGLGLAFVAPPTLAKAHTSVITTNIWYAGSNGPGGRCRALAGAVQFTTRAVDQPRTPNTAPNASVATLTVAKSQRGRAP